MLPDTLVEIGGNLAKGLNKVKPVHVMFDTKTELAKWLEDVSLLCSRGLLAYYFRYNLKIILVIYG